MHLPSHAAGPLPGLIVFQQLAQKAAQIQNGGKPQEDCRRDANRSCFLDYPSPPLSNSFSTASNGISRTPTRSPKNLRTNSACWGKHTTSNFPLWLHSPSRKRSRRARSPSRWERTFTAPTWASYSMVPRPQVRVEGSKSRSSSLSCQSGTERIPSSRAPKPSRGRKWM